jgi:uncharacterized membrane protein YjjP (DUF1212 family)
MPWTRRFRSRVGQLAVDTEPPTLPGVFLNRGAYEPGAQQHDAPARDSRAFEVMDLALRCGAQLLARGTAAVDVESALHAAATTLGLRQVDVDVTYTSLMLSAVVDGRPVAVTRVVRQGTPDYARLSDVHRLLSDIVAGDVDLHAAQTRLAAIEARPRRHSSRVTLLANGVLAGSIAASLGSGWVVAVVAALTGIVIVALTNRLHGPRAPAFFLAGAGGAVAVAVTSLVTLADIDVRPSLVVAAAIVVLLPSVPLVGSVRDALVGFPLTAIGRAVDGAIVVIGIVAGVTAALAVAAAADVGLQIIPSDQVPPTPLAVRFLAGALVAASAAVVYQAGWRMVAASFAVGGVGFAAGTLMLGAIDSTTFATGVAAVVVGVVAGAMATRWHTLALVFVVPGIMPLLPGLVIYRGSLLLTSGDTVEGLVVLLEAGVRMLALAAGALLGELLVSRWRG